MKRSTFSNSSGMLLSLKEWIVALVLVVLISGFIYYRWDSWETFNPVADYRETCWDEKMTD
jgi:hypothetical protein